MQAQQELEWLSDLVAVSGLIHDLGKASEGSDRKLRDAVAGLAPASDTLRHELVSFALIAPLRERPDPFAALSTPEGVAHYFAGEGARGLEAAGKALESWRRVALETAGENAEDLASDQLPRSGIIALPGRRDWQHSPAWAAWSWLVLSHHRLPGGVEETPRRRRRGAQSQSPVECRLTLDPFVKPAEAGRLAQFTRLAEARMPWEDPRWCEALAARCARLSAGLRAGVLKSAPRLEANERFTNALAFLARPALIFADYLASGNPDHREVEDSVLCARTVTREGVRYRVEPLTEHLIEVGERAAAIFRGLHLESESPFRSLTSLPPGARPQSLRELAAERDSPFYWQTHARRALAERVPEGSGFFGVMLAGTGSGKTAAGAQFLDTLAGELRMTVALGLRTLTTQTFSAYTSKPIDFAPADVALLLGQSAPVDQALLGNLPGDEQNTPAVPLAEGSPHAVLAPPPVAGVRNASQDNPLLAMVTRAKERALLSRPVSVLTIDHLVRGANLTRGGDTRTLLHLMSADLVIDEIDEFAADDLVSIGRLVYLAALFGRRVLIASATAPPGVVEGLYSAYLEGFAIHQQWHGERPVRAALISDTQPFCEVHRTPASLRRAYRLYTGRRIAALNRAEPRHRPEVINLERAETPLGAAVTPILSGCARLHRRRNNHVRDPQTGLRLSIGFVRFSRVADAQRFTLDAAAASPPVGMALKLVCYHARHTGIDRQAIEDFFACLDRNEGSDRLLAEPRVRAALEAATAAGLEDLMIVVASTSILETGRDYDFDWAVAEPSSTRSLIQAAGRVWRHRRDRRPEAANIAVFDQPLRALRVDGLIWSYPGIETPNTENVSEYRVLTHPMSANIPGLRSDGTLVAREGERRAVSATVEALGERMTGERVDAAASLARPRRYERAPLTALEHLAYSDRLVRKSSIDAPLSAPGLPGFLYRGDVKLCSALARILPFRRRREYEPTVYFSRTEPDHYDLGSARVLSGSAVSSVVVRPLPELDEGRFLIHPRPGEDYADLCVRFALEPESRRARALLCGTTLRPTQLRRALYHHPCIGFVVGERE